MKFPDSSGTSPRRHGAQERDRLTVPEVSLKVPEMCRLRVEVAHKYSGQRPLNEPLPKIEHRCSIRDKVPQSCEAQKWNHHLDTGKMAERAPVPNKWNVCAKPNGLDRITIQGTQAQQFHSQNKISQSDKVIKVKPVCFPEIASIGQTKYVGAQPGAVKNTATTGIGQNKATETDSTPKLQLTKGEQPISGKVMHIPKPPEMTKETKTFKRKYKQKEDSSLKTKANPPNRLEKINQKGKLTKDSPETGCSDRYNSISNLSKSILDKRQALPQIRCNTKTDVEAITTIVKIKGPQQPNTHAIYDTIAIDTSKPIHANPQVMGLLKPILPNIQDNRKKNHNNSTKKTAARQTPKDNLPDVYTLYARQSKTVNTE